MFGIDLSSITSFFSGAQSHAQVALTTSGNWLPAAGWLAGTAALLAVAAVLIILFLKMLRLGLQVAIAAGVLAFLAAVAFGYEAKGENDIIPKLNVANARIANDELRAESFRQEAAAAQVTIVAKSKSTKAALAAAEKSNRESLNAQPPTVTAVPVHRSVSVLINSAIATANDTALGPGAGDAARAAAASGAPINFGDVEAWALTAIDDRAQLANQVSRLLDIQEALGLAGSKADAEHPANAPPPPEH